MVLTVKNLNGLKYLYNTDSKSFYAKSIFCICATIAVIFSTVPSAQALTEHIVDANTRDLYHFTSSANNNILDNSVGGRGALLLNNSPRFTFVDSFEGCSPDPISQQTCASVYANTTFGTSFGTIQSNPDWATGPFTYEFWYKNDLANTNNHNPFRLVDTGLDIRTTAFPTIDLLNTRIVAGACTLYADVTDPVIFDGNWHYIAVTYSTSPSILKLYVDGDFKTLDANCTPAIPVTTNFPTVFDNQNAFTLDELRISNIERTSPEIVSHYLGVSPSLDSVVLSVNSTPPFYVGDQIELQVDWELTTYTGSHIYVSRDAELSPQLSTLINVNSGSYIFNVNYDYSYNYNAFVDVRSCDIGATCDSVSTTVPIQVLDPLADQTVFTTDNSTPSSGDLVQFQWDLDDSFYSLGVDSVELDLGIPVYIEPIVDLGTSDSGSYLYQYDAFGPNNVFYPTLLINYQGETYKHSLSFIKGGNVVIPTVVSTDDVGGGQFVGSEYYHLSTQFDTYNTGDDVIFAYYYDLIPSLSYVSTDFYPHVGATPVTLSTTDGSYQTFNHSYTQPGLKSPRLVVNYTNGTGSVSHDIYLGGLDTIQGSETITITDSSTYCDTFPLFTDSGIYSDCASLIIELPTFSFINNTVNFFTYGTLWFSSYFYSLLEATYVYQAAESFFNPTPGVYELDKNILGMVNTPGAFFELPDEVTIPPRRQFNSNNLDILIEMLIYLMLINYIFNRIVFYFQFRK